MLTQPAAFPFVGLAAKSAERSLPGGQKSRYEPTGVSCSTTGGSAIQCCRVAWKSLKAGTVNKGFRTA
jgi:hypothetical protein